MFDRIVKIQIYSSLEQEIGSGNKKQSQNFFWKQLILIMIPCCLNHKQKRLVLSYEKVVCHVVRKKYILHAFVYNKICSKSSRNPKIL